MQSTITSSYIIGYRIGMITARTGSLYLASYLGGDTNTYNVAS